MLGLERRAKQGGTLRVLLTKQQRYVAHGTPGEHESLLTPLTRECLDDYNPVVGRDAYAFTRLKNKATSDEQVLDRDRRVRSPLHCHSNGRPSVCVLRRR